MKRPTRPGIFSFSSRRNATVKTVERQSALIAASPPLGNLHAVNRSDQLAYRDSGEQGWPAVRAHP